MRSADGNVGATTVASPVMGTSCSAWLSSLFISANLSASGFRSMEYATFGFANLQICIPVSYTHLTLPTIA